MSERRTQIFEVSTLYGAATLAAAVDAGQFGPAEEARRLLLVCNNAGIPETSAQVEEMAGWDRVAARFDRVLSWNETISPYHPSQWAPQEGDEVLWQRLLREAWGIGEGPFDLVVESAHAKPAATLAAIFADADIHVYADGLMVYGPTRERLPWPTGCRVRRLLHPDLVPGLRPLLLAEYDTPAEVVPAEAFRAVLDEITAQYGRAEEDAPVAGGEGTAVLLGQYLAALNLISAREEEELHERMLRGAAAAGCRTIVFKPHPTAPAQYSKALEKAAADEGVSLTVLDSPMLAETLFARVAPQLVVGCFSTALLTASALYGLPIARVGTGLLLERIVPYQNSNRVPLTLVDALVPDLLERRGGEVVTRRPEAAAELAPLLRAVGYCMQPKLHPGLRPEAESWLGAHGQAEAARYFKRGRLTALALPGGFAANLTRQLPGGRTALRIARNVKRRATRR
ncbi:polysialyltransferase family glycosyltransferase [Streptomyces hoynatensis]|uniref:Uncharacterized protein n=1 Tax=Streptomyces hoynatensis TaxID=1141874 RepID=A0A3A9YMP4_9ACTN|nr:polysialyltransferase family glycosyltransferase [Streptomyces hoynatensis]RKN37505.1 hypothetical protein D7294_27585 [Streptomyces hoynatensis]